MGGTEVKLPEDVAESFWEEFSALLDEGGSRWNIIGQEIKIFQQFMVDASASYAEEETEQLDKPQLPVTGKIFSRVFNKLGSVTGHVIHDCPESGLDLLSERHIDTSYLKLK